MIDVEQEVLKLAIAVAKRVNAENNDLITDLVEDALAQVLDYTGQSKLFSNLEIYVKRLAVVNYNRLGLEGETQRSEGGVTNYLETGIPKDIRQGLNRYRIARMTKL